MSTVKTAGQKVREGLDRTLGPGMEWDEAELVTLSSIEHATDRLAVFRALFDTTAANPKASPARLATLSGECRLLEGAIAKWTASLDPSDNQAKSLRHVAAANARWHRASGT